MEQRAAALRQRLAGVDVIAEQERLLGHPLEEDIAIDLLAAGLYGLLKADGYAREGGVIQDWLGQTANEGRLAPASLHTSAAGVLGLPVEQLWMPPERK